MRVCVCACVRACMRVCMRVCMRIESRGRGRAERRGGGEEGWILRDKLLWKSLWVQLELRPGWARWSAECDEDMRDGGVRTGN